MDLQYFGANSVKVTTKKSVISVNPVSDIVALKTDLKKTTIVLGTKPEFIGSVPEGVFVIDSPGEYEFEDCSIKGIAAQPHTGTTGDVSATIYRLTTAEATILFVGHIDSKLTEDQLETIGIVDVVVVPVGGGGYTLDAIGAASVIRALEPKVVIPVHASDDGLAYDVPQQETALFIKELGAPIAEETVDKYKPKSLPESLTVQLLNKQ